VTLLDTGCTQQPLPGKTISVEGDPFSVQIVNATDPSPTPSLSPDHYTSSSFTLGAKVGIAVGGLLLVLAIAGFCIVWNGKRRRRAFLRRLEARTGGKGWPTPSTNAEMFETPVSQRALRGWDDSPSSAHTEKHFPPYFSPYQSQYNSPVSAVEGPSQPQWPVSNSLQQQQQQEIGIALGGDDSSGHWDEGEPSRGKKRQESYEMHEVESEYSGSGKMPMEPEPPVLHHPGFGRQGANPPRNYTLTEEDAKRGHAV
jgi:hypothetical protein